MSATRHLLRRGAIGTALPLAVVGCSGPDVTAPATEVPQVSAGASPSLSQTGRIAFVSNRDGNNEIYVMNADGTGLTRLSKNLADDRQPAWSTDGKKIAFVSNRAGNDEIYTMNADGSGVIRVTHDTAADRSPAWSPNGARIAFVSNRADQHNEIYVMNANGSSVTRLTRNLREGGCNFCKGGPSEAPAWSPDGAKIAFLQRESVFGWGLFLMSPNESGLARLTSGGFATKLAWGRTGKIAFDPRVVPGQGLGDGEIEFVTVTGASVTRLTNNTAQDVSPNWSPDATKLVFTSDRDGDFEIYAMSATATGITKLTHNSAFDGEPAWGP